MVSERARKEMFPLRQSILTIAMTVAIWPGVARTAGGGTSRTLTTATSPTTIAVATPQTIALTPPQGAPMPTMQPPLSVNESCMILRQIIEELEGRQGPTAARVAQIDRMLGAINMQIERLDRANPTLPDYTWREIISQKVTESEWQTVLYELKTPAENISAVALRAHHGDIQASQVVAIDDNGTQWTFEQPMIMTDGESHVEICLLPIPMQLKKLKLTCRQMAEKPTRYPRLLVEIGVSPTPEYARQARHHLQVARAELAGKKARKAAASLRETFDLLQEFQRSKRN
ncbi:hypothetical protein LLG95_13785 [bacterium]|nr:hypothetical protein [bacterium]